MQRPLSQQQVRAVVDAARAHGRAPRLEGTFLGGVDFRGLSLGGACLQGAALHDTNFTGVDLRGAQLQSADLRGAQLAGADLRGADLHDANLHDADLRGANMQGAQLKGANLTNTDLRGANLHLAYLGIRVVDRIDLSMLRRARRTLYGRCLRIWHRLFSSTRAADLTITPEIPL